MTNEERLEKEALLSKLKQALYSPWQSISSDGKSLSAASLNDLVQKVELLEKELAEDPEDQKTVLFQRISIGNY